MSILILEWPTLNGFGLRWKYHKRQVQRKAHVLTQQDSSGYFRFLENVSTPYIKHNGLSAVNKYTVRMTHPLVFWHSSCITWPLDVQAFTLLRNARNQLPVLYCAAPPPPQKKKKTDDLNYTSLLFGGILSALLVCGTFSPMYGSVRLGDFCRRIAPCTVWRHVSTLLPFSRSPFLPCVVASVPENTKH